MPLWQVLALEVQQGVVVLQLEVPEQQVVAVLESQAVKILRHDQSR